MVERAPSEPSRKRKINSIVIGFRLLRVLEGAKSKLPLKTIAKLAGMPASKAYLYMASFTEVGLVSQNPTTAHYGLGPQAVHLGLSAIRQLKVVDLVEAPMEALREEFGLAVYLSVWGNMGPVIVRKLDGELEGPVRMSVGHVVPLLSTATGRVFLAHLAEGLTKWLSERERLQDPALARRAETAAASVREIGLGFSDEHFGAGAISAPIFDHSGAIIATLTMYGLGNHVKLSPSHRMAVAIRSAAVEISAELGYPPRPPHIEEPPAVKPKPKRGSVQAAADAQTQPAARRSARAIS